MKRIFMLSMFVVSVVCISEFAIAQPAGPVPAGPGGAVSESKGPEAPSMQGPPGVSGPPAEAPSFALTPHEPSGDIFFTAGIVSPDGKIYYVAFDRYLMKFKLPELKLLQKADLGIPVAPVSPSISISPDGKWIYVIQNGVVMQIEKESLSIKKTVSVSQ